MRKKFRVFTIISLLIAAPLTTCWASTDLEYHSYHKQGGTESITRLSIRRNNPVPLKQFLRNEYTEELKDLQYTVKEDKKEKKVISIKKNPFHVSVFDNGVHPVIGKFYVKSEQPKPKKGECTDNFSLTITFIYKNGGDIKLNPINFKLSRGDEKTVSFKLKDNVPPVDMINEIDRWKVKIKLEELGDLPLKEPSVPWYSYLGINLDRYFFGKLLIFCVILTLLILLVYKVYEKYFSGKKGSRKAEKEKKGKNFRNRKNEQR